MTDRIAGVAATTPTNNGDGGCGPSLLTQRAAAEPDISLEQAVAALNRHFGAQQPPLSFHTSRDQGDLVVTVIDTRDNQIVRQIPSAEVLSLARKLARGAPALMNTQQA
jgi:flagellar protein FlaG